MSQTVEISALNPRNKCSKPQNPEFLTHAQSCQVEACESVPGPFRSGSRFRLFEAPSPTAPNPSSVFASLLVSFSFPSLCNACFHCASLPFLSPCHLLRQDCTGNLNTPSHPGLGQYSACLHNRLLAACTHNGTRKRLRGGSRASGYITVKSSPKRSLSNTKAEQCLLVASTSASTTMLG